MSAVPVVVLLLAAIWFVILWWRLRPPIRRWTTTRALGPDCARPCGALRVCETNGSVSVGWPQQLAGEVIALQIEERHRGLPDV